MCWIVTLDVLKSHHVRFIQKKLNRWIVTLDVLKFRIKNVTFHKSLLNSNIRCIEILKKLL